MASHVNRRRVAAAATVAAAGGAFLVGGATPAHAHGIGGRADLPVPLSYFIVGASTAIVISFLVLAARWPEPRLQDGPRHRPLRAPGLLGLLRTLRVLGLAGLGLVVTAGLVDGTETSRNIAPVLVWVVFWLVVPYSAALLGDVWWWASPFRSLARWVNAERPERPDLGATLGVWPATVAFACFTWLELVSFDSAEPRTLAAGALLYTLYVIAMTYWMGVDTGLRAGEAFDPFVDMLARISPLEVTPRRTSLGADTITADTVVEWRGWLRSLPALAVRRGTTWFILTAIGTVTYDGLSSTEWWGRSFESVANEQWFGTLALVGTVAAVGAGYYVAAWAASRLAAGSGLGVLATAASFAHTLVPIALAYAFSHYFTLVVFEGQQIVHAASDPFGLGWNLFGTAQWRSVLWLSPTAIWWIQLTSIVLGHVAGTVLAHDRALHLFGHRRAVRSQYAMLVLMVALTSLGLFILAG
jgi:hypothetical protein